MKCIKTPMLSRTLSFFLVGCLLLLTGAPVPIAAKIVFCVDDDIFVMDDDGSRRRRLTHSPEAIDQAPRWSPDGKRIAFHRAMDRIRNQTTLEVFIMNADGTALQRLTHNNDIDTYPSWSPDGHSLAFTSGRSGDGAVHVLDLATLAVTQLTDAPSACPDWSPDGKQIVFERFIRGKAGISPKTVYVMSADGQHQRPAVLHPPLEGPLTLAYFPRWSADGQRILYAEVKWHRDGDLEELVVQKVGGVKRVITAINDRLGNNWLAPVCLGWRMMVRSCSPWS